MISQDEIRMLLEASDRLISAVSMGFRRYLVPKINWNEAMLCIKGPKGTGKTTLMLQHIKETFGAGSFWWIGVASLLAVCILSYFFSRERS